MHPHPQDQPRSLHREVIAGASYGTWDSHFSSLSFPLFLLMPASQGKLIEPLLCARRERCWEGTGDLPRKGSGADKQNNHKVGREAQRCLVPNLGWGSGTHPYRGVAGDESYRVRGAGNQHNGLASNLGSATSWLWD